jgi:lipopolysaccharide export system permease protein
MPILHRYLLHELMRFALIVLTVVVGIYLAVDFFEKIDDFIEKSVPLSRSAAYFAYKLPFVAAQVAPVCLLLSVLIVLGLMTKNNEIIALKSSGVSIGFLLRPMLMMGILGTIALFIASETIVPLTMSRANLIWLREVRRDPAFLTREKNIWIKEPGSICHIHFYNPEKQTIFGLICSQFDENFNLIRRIDASRAVFRSGRWHLEDGQEQVFGPDGQGPAVTYFAAKVENVDFAPDSLQQVVKKSEEMGFIELARYVAMVDAEGYDATPYRVDLHAKLSFPLVCIIMILVGSATAFKRKVRDGLAVNIAYGIGIAFCYWVLHSFCLSLGYGGMLPAVVAAWMSNFIFISLSGYILSDAN